MTLVALRMSAVMLDRGLRGRAANDAMLIETLAEPLTLHRRAAGGARDTGRAGGEIPVCG